MSKIAPRGQYMLSQSSFLAEAWIRQKQDEYQAETNPNGVVNFGTSENKLMEEIIMAKTASVDLSLMPVEYTHYCDFIGLPSFRKALADFMTRYMKARKPVEADNLGVVVGVGSAVELLGFCLFDEGDGVLIPAPFYGAFHTDFVSRGGVHPVSVPLSSDVRHEFGETEPYQLSVGRIKETYEAAIAKGIKVKGLLLTNPNNPLGSVYSEELLKECMDFCHNHQLHIMIDEVYMLSTFESDAAARMKCVLSLNHIPDPERTHVFYGFSKDFGVSGFRCGLFHTWNKDLLACARRVGYLASVPTVTQHILEAFVSDYKWLDEIYIPTFQKRLKQAQEYARNEFKKANVYCLPSQACLFCWIDLRRYLKAQSFKAEEELFQKFFDNKIYITPSQGFYGLEPGWFRVVISCNMEILKVGLQRITNTLKGLEASTTCQNGGDDLGELVQKFHREVRGSDWLKENTAEKWQKENPEVAKAYLAELEKNNMTPNDLK